MSAIISIHVKYIYQSCICCLTGEARNIFKKGEVRRMRKKSLTKALFAIMLVLLLALAACNSESSSDKNTKGSGDGDKAADNGGKSKDGLYDISDFDKKVTSDDEAIDGGELNFGLVTDTAFEGTLNYNFYSGNYDVEVIKWFDDALLDVDENYNYTQDGAATYEVNDEGNEFTFKIRDEVNWSDGEPVTAEDWELSYLVIGDPDYDGIRYGSDFTIIEGMDEYHAGDADDISGVEVIDDKTLKITFKKATPSLENGGIWPYAMPKHIFKDIPVADMAESDAVRKNPVGFGPFKVESIVPGESVVYTKNEDYWRGEPKLDKVTLQVINPDTVIQALKEGKIDMTSEQFPTDQFPDNADMTNVQFLGDVDMAYTYIGFKLGKWDGDKGEVVPDSDMKMANKDLRKAMWQAVDNDAIGEKFYHGLRWNATTLIPPSHPKFHDDSNEGVKYDPEAAKKLLDEAGYVDTNDDGFREDPDGNELVINFASMSGGDTAEPLANYYIQSWEKIGLKVELLDGRLQEFNTFYDRVEGDDPKIDIYQGAWGVGDDVDPSGLYGRDAAFNYTRYASKENDKLLEEGVSEEAFDPDKRKEIYDKWQELMVEEIPVFPTLYRSKMVVVNNRVKDWDVSSEANPRHEVSVTEDKPEINE